LGESQQVNQNKSTKNQYKGIQTKVMQNKDKGDGIEGSPLDMLLVILLEGVSMEVSWLFTPSSIAVKTV